MERGYKINQNIWDLTAREQVRITPEAIQFGASAFSHSAIEEPILQSPSERATCVPWKGLNSAALV